MAKSSGTSRSGSASSPRGLGNVTNELNSIRNEASAIVQDLQGRGLYSSDRLLELRTREESLLRDELMKEAGKNGWKERWDGAISKKLGNDEPIMNISVERALNKIGENGYFEARVGGAQVARDNTKARAEMDALWNNDKRFETAREAVRWIEREANRINRKYKGKI